VARNSDFKTVRIEKILADRATKHADLIGWSFNQFCENAVKVFCDMAEDPAKRVVPDVIRQIESLRPLSPALNIYSIPQPELLRAAEEPTIPKTNKKQRA
jgi:hypothetical protein